MNAIRKALFSTRRRQIGFGCGSLLMAGCCLTFAAAAISNGSPTPPAAPKPAATQVLAATATLEEIVLDTDTPTRAPSVTPIAAAATKKPATAAPSSTTIPPTAIPPTATRVRITFTPAPVQAADTATAAPVIQDTPTAAPVIQDTPTAAPQPTQAPPPSGGGYVCDGGAACIKGNISSNGHLYHFPGCPSYNATKIDEGAGERYFTSAAEAEAAGWTKASNCP